MRKGLKFLVLCYLLFSFFPKVGEIYAQEIDGSGLAISPVVFEINGDPGERITNQLKVYNPTTNPISVKMEVSDFTPVGEDGEVSLVDPGENLNYSLAQWTKVSPQSFTLQPNAQQIVSFQIEPPIGAEPGGHYGSIVASTVTETDEAVTGATVASKRGALVLLKVSGDVKEELNIQSFKSLENFQSSGPVDFEIKFNNTGNVHVRPAGFISVTDIFGNQVAQIEIDQKNVIPDATRKVETRLDKEGLFGIYNATLVANYGNGNKQTISAVTSFTVLPLTNIIVVAAIIVAAAVLIFLMRKRLKLAVQVLMGKNPQHNLATSGRRAGKS